MLAFCVVMILPFYYLVASSLKTRREMGLYPLNLPTEFYLGNFESAWQQIRFWNAFANTLTITIATLFIVVLFGALAAYSVARRKGLGYKIVMFYFLLGFMVPLQTTMVPLYRLMLDLGLMNSISGVIILATGQCVFSFFLYLGFIRTVPYELEESARIDGAGPVRVFFQIVFPLLKPITVTLTIFHVMATWNDFVIPFLFLHSRSNSTLMLEMQRSVGEFSNDWPVMMAVMILIMVPLVIFYLAAQRHIIDGLTSGAVKG
jgi:raffinose/stachyose/melibiose transport system permease protein